jgi:hypothetical protein
MPEHYIDTELPNEGYHLQMTDLPLWRINRNYACWLGLAAYGGRIF